MSKKDKKPDHSGDESRADHPDIFAGRKKGGYTENELKPNQPWPEDKVQPPKPKE